MLSSIDKAEETLNLRRRALSQLGAGTQRSLARDSPTEALAVLHTLASSPATAGDALALLHELQVHQVELDLQREELSRSRTELEAELSRQKTLVDHAPVAYLTLDATTRVHELNHAAARLLGAARDELQGGLLTRYLSARSGQALVTLLTRVAGGAEPQTCELQLAADLPQVPALLAVASPDPAGGRCLVALVEGGARGTVAAG